MTDPTDRFSAARSVADAVLYEGYVLYPYRASSRKNQVRFQWGVLTPRAFSEAEGSERCRTRTECLCDPGADTSILVRVRCLQAQHRSVEVALDPAGQLFEPADFLEVDGTLHVDWDEAVDQVIDLPAIALGPEDTAEIADAFSLDGSEASEMITDAVGATAGRFIRRRQRIEGVVQVATSRPDPDANYLRIAVTIENTTAWTGDTVRRDDAMGHSLIAVHTMLAVDGGRFVSLLDYPPDAKQAVEACRSDGSYPVLIGDEDVVLASPIILYDHPEVAAQSPGDLYDSLEIDEILALRVMTLTDEEKSEARGTDARAAAVIDRCDNMSAEILGRLHGQMVPVPAAPRADDADDTDADTSAVQWWDPEADAAVDPWTDSVWVAGVEITKGSVVRLRPSQRSDAQDMFVDGLAGTVGGVFTDVDGETHVAVTIDDDPATEELLWQGRYLFFRPDEVEPLRSQDRGP